LPAGGVHDSLKNTLTPVGLSDTTKSEASSVPSGRKARRKKKKKERRSSFQFLKKSEGAVGLYENTMFPLAAPSRNLTPKCEPCRNFNIVITVERQNVIDAGVVVNMREPVLNVH
jgi:hypothetical protein